MNPYLIVTYEIFTMIGWNKFATIRCFTITHIAQSAVAVKYTDCISAEG